MELERRHLRKHCATSLGAFIETFWHVVEPEREFVWSWALAAVCEHLEAVSHGQIQNLLMNVPPGFMKSLATDVFWPAWEWGALRRPSNRFLSFSYSSSLTERDNGRFGLVVQSPLYTSLFGDVVTFRPYMLGATKVANKQTGWKIASSVGGVGTGERADRIICFPYSEILATAEGPRAIGEIVETKAPVWVWSVNRKTNAVELAPVVGWHTNPGRPLLRITCDTGQTVTCTEDHRILVPGGEVEASSLRIGDRLLAAPRRVRVAVPGVIGSEVEVEVSPCTPVPDAGNDTHGDPKFLGEDGSGIVMARGNLADQVLGEVRGTVLERAVPLAVRNVLGAGAVLQIAQRGIAAVAVFVADLLSFGARTDKGQHHKLVAESVQGLAGAAQRDARVALVLTGLHQSARNRKIMAAPLNDVGNAADAPEAGNLIGRKPWNDAPHFARVVSVELLHDVPPATYCVTVAGNHNMLIGGECGDIFCSNCDDPHNVKEAESAAIRAETVRWFRESLTTRYNDAKTSATIVIMQRVHEDDVSGVILSEDFGYTHLMIPMSYDPTRHCVTYLPGSDEPFWEDPRTEEGELAFPERFPPEAVTRDEIRMGPTAAAAQFQQSPTPRGGNIINRDWWQLWPAEGYEPKPGEPLAYPLCELITGSVDTAYGEKDENAWNAMQVWGVWRDRRERPKVILMEAWRARLPLRGVIPEDCKTDEERRPHWGLAEKIADTVRRRNISVLLIEDKTRGADLAAEIRRLLRDGECLIVMINPKKDKTARLHSVQPMFADGMVYAPDRNWAETVISEVSQWPKSKWADHVDTCSQALSWLRNNNLLLLGTEADSDNVSKQTFRSPRKAAYDV